MRSNRIGATSWTFYGHVTSSVRVTIWIPMGHFLLVVVWNRGSISNGFRDIQWRMWRNGWHDLKQPL